MQDRTTSVFCLVSLNLWAASSLFRLHRDSLTHSHTHIQLDCDSIQTVSSRTASKMFCHDPGRAQYISCTLVYTWIEIWRSADRQRATCSAWKRFGYFRYLAVFHEVFSGCISVKFSRLKSTELCFVCVLGTHFFNGFLISACYLLHVVLKNRYQVYVTSKSHRNFSLTWAMVLFKK